MSPPQAMNESPEDYDDVAATTHRSLPQSLSSSSSPHNRHTTLRSIPETEDDERLDETSTTLHEPTREIAANAVEPQNFSVEEKADGFSEASLKIHRKVAEIAADSYRIAAEDSQVLSNVILADLALVNIKELTIGKFLGSGSFSHVQ